MANKYSESDYWTQKAKAEGYPARSVYKLEEINNKFSLFSKSAKVLDLGASPGSWTVYLLRALNKRGKVVAIDLKTLDDKIEDERLTFIQGDMTDQNVISKVESLAPFDAVLCDAAPYTTGNKAVDVPSQNYLVELAVFYAEKMLTFNGSFVAKIFQGGNLKPLLDSLRESFSLVRTFKPISCRKNSIETYIIGKNFKKRNYEKNVEAE